MLCHVYRDHSTQWGAYTLTYQLFLQILHPQTPNGVVSKLQILVKRSLDSMTLIITRYCYLKSASMLKVQIDDQPFLEQWSFS